MQTDLVGTKRNNKGSGLLLSPASPGRGEHANRVRRPSRRHPSAYS